MSMMQIASIQFQLYRKAIKYLRIRVLPPDGRVHVSAPLRMAESLIQAFIVNHIPWIQHQQNNIAKQPRQLRHEMVTGERHYLWGRSYYLDVVQHTGRHKVKLSEEKLHLYINANALLEKRELALTRYYRAELKNHIERLLPYWKNKIGVSPNAWGIKKMKTRWGSCNVQAKRIWLSLELAKKPLECLEYVLVHELVHLLERSHNAQFKAYMDKFLSDWRDRKDLLNQTPVTQC